MLTQDYNATLQSRTHWLVARANAQTKTSQRVCLSSRSKDKILIKHERTTRGIKHWGLSGYANILPRIKFGLTGQESSPQSPTISYRQPLCLTLNLPHIQAHLVFQLHKSKAKNQKSLNFLYARKKKLQKLNRRNIITIFVKIVKIKTSRQWKQILENTSEN